MQCNQDVSPHSSNNKGDYIYGDPSHLSMEDEILTEEDEQALHEAFLFIPTAKTVRFKTSDVAPIAMVKVKTINQIQVARPLVCLLDSGSTGTMIQSRALPPGVIPNVSKQKRITTTANGSFDTSRSVAVEHIQLPEFVNGRVVGGVEARLFDAPSCRYDIIFGRDFLRLAKMQLNFHTNTVNWLGVELEMKPVDHYMIDDVIDIGMQPKGFYQENIMAMCLLRF